MPSSRAIARSDSPAAPCSTRWRRPSSTIFASICSRESWRLATRPSLARDHRSCSCVTPLTRYSEGEQCSLADLGRSGKTGKQRSVVVNPLIVDGAEYLVSPRGNTQWARNVRAAGVVETGSRWRWRRTTASEITDDAKPEILRRYLDRWYWQVKSYVGDVTARSSNEALRIPAARIPVFALVG